MNFSKFKADEMEMYINFKSMRIAFVFIQIGLAIYCICHLCIDKFLPDVFAIWVLSMAIYWTSNLIFRRKMAKGQEDEE